MYLVIHFSHCFIHVNICYQFLNLFNICNFIVGVNLDTRTLDMTKDLGSLI